MELTQMKVSKQNSKFWIPPLQILETRTRPQLLTKAGFMRPNSELVSKL